MQVSLTKCRQLLRTIAPSGNLFLLVSLQELRRQGLTFIAFYVLQRIIEEQRIFESTCARRRALRTMRSAGPVSFLPAAD